MTWYNIVTMGQKEQPITNVASIFGMSGVKLNKLLIEWGIYQRKDDRYELTRPYQGLGYVWLCTTEYTTTSGFLKRKYFLKWTLRGRKFLISELERHGYQCLPFIESNKNNRRNQIVD